MKPWNDSRVASGFFVGALSTIAFSALVPTLGAQGPHKVVAPFQVVDKKGVVIMEVTARGERPRGLHLFNEGGKEVAVMNVLGTGAIVKVFKAGSNDHYAVTLGATDDLTGILLREGGSEPRLTIGAENGALGMRVFNASGKLTAAIGHIATGSGLATIYDATGTQRANVSGTYGTVAVRNAKGAVVAGLGSANEIGVIEVVNGEQAIAKLTQDAGGTGLLQVMDAGGTPLVDASISNGIGFVRAYPMSKFTLPGIPGSSIQGRR
jgi:hypothetical protein